MKGILVQTTLYGEEALREIIKSGKIGKDINSIGFQLPAFEDIPISFCSYVCAGYPETYGDREGISFETDAPVVYACPIDTFNLLRGGIWLPGHERFVFTSIESMLKKFPNRDAFKEVFQKYFKALNPREVYPRNESVWAEEKHASDYCLMPNWEPGCNEVTFSKPVKVKNCRIFKSKLELEALVI